MRFFVACDEDIKNGKTTDIYFMRSKEILEKEQIKKNVVAEFTVQGANYPWMVFAGIEEIAALMDGKNIDIYSLSEGTIFKETDQNGIPIPVMVVKGDYKEFSVYETPMLGLICQASGIATKSARFKKLMADKKLISFGVRRMHPALSPMIDHYSFIGGCDAVSSILGAEMLELEPSGTMPHALILTMGEEEAWLRFDEKISKKVPRIALIDTFGDEKYSSIKAAEIIGDLSAVRLDTPKSRRGNFANIVKEVRWELDVRGYNNVQIFVSGGVHEEDIPDLIAAGATGFGIGTSISSAQSIDFAMDIVAVDHKPFAKKGKFGGEKYVYKCDKCEEFLVSYSPKDSCSCGGKLKDALIPVIKNGKIVYDFKKPEKVRNYVLEQLSLWRL